MMQIYGLSSMAALPASGKPQRRTMRQSVAFSGSKPKSLSIAAVLSALIAAVPFAVAGTGASKPAASAEKVQAPDEDWKRQIEIAAQMDALSLQGADAITDLANALRTTANNTMPGTPTAQALAQAARDLSQYRRNSEALGVTPELIGKWDRQLTMGQWIAFVKYVDAAYNIELLLPDRKNYALGYFKYIEHFVNTSGNDVLIQQFNEGRVKVDRLEDAYCALKPSACINRNK